MRRCTYCGRSLRRKRTGRAGWWETPRQFAARRYCGHSCASRSGVRRRRWGERERRTILALRRDGLSLRVISARVGLSHETVRSVCQAG